MKATKVSGNSVCRCLFPESTFMLLVFQEWISGHSHWIYSSVNTQPLQATDIFLQRHTRTLYYQTQTGLFKNSSAQVDHNEMCNGLFLSQVNNYILGAVHQFLSLKFIREQSLGINKKKFQILTGVTCVFNQRL